MDELEHGRNDLSYKFIFYFNTLRTLIFSFTSVKGYKVNERRNYAHKLTFTIHYMRIFRGLKQ